MTELTLIPGQATLLQLEKKRTIIKPKKGAMPSSAENVACSKRIKLMLGLRRGEMVYGFG